MKTQIIKHHNQPCDNPAMFCDWCAMDGCLNGGKGLVKKAKRAKRPRDDDDGGHGGPFPSWGFHNPYGIPGPFGGF